MAEGRCVLESGEFVHASDWHVDSLLRFAEMVRQTLGCQNPNGLPETERVLCALFDKFIQAARAYYCRGLQLLENDSPYQRQQLVERIGQEWSQLMALLPTWGPASEIEQVKYVINRAWRDLKMPRQQVAVLPHLRRHFELVKFEYAPEINIVGIPITSLYCPWEWTMVWHELAGIYIQTPEAKTLVQELRAAVPQEVWQGWLKTAGVPATEQVWQGWMEEFVEDAIAVLCLGNAMAESLDQILAQHYSDAPEVSGTDADEASGSAVEIATDLRHPPRHLRVQLARSLTYQMGLRESDDVKDENVRHLAKAIWEHRDEMVSRVFTVADDRDLDWVKRQSDAAEAFILIPAALRAFYQADGGGRREIVDTIRETVSTCLIERRAPETMRVAPGEFERGLEKIDNWSDLMGCAFSEVDRGSASKVGTHASHVGASTITIEISGIASHFLSHDCVVEVTHTHAYGNMNPSGCDV